MSKPGRGSPPISGRARGFAYDGGVRRRLKRMVVARVGRPLRCERCGEVLCLVLPIVRGGRVKLEGLEWALVRVDFDSMNHLVFSHVEAGRCPALRP